MAIIRPGTVYDTEGQEEHKFIDYDVINLKVLSEVYILESGLDFIISSDNKEAYIQILNCLNEIYNEDQND